MVFYLTYNDAPSGIYSSQVIDVVDFLNTELNTKTKLVAFISLRRFFENRKKIKQQLSKALVLPMFPGVHRWRYNFFLLNLYCFIYKPHTIIGRSVLATQLALKHKNIKIIYDGRGAIAAEWEEYNVITNPTMLSEIRTLEQDCILKSDYRIAVSEQLITYWKKEYDYNSTNHITIPCTLNKVFEYVVINKKTISEKKAELGFEKDDVVFVYSGSVAGWQSFDILINFISPILNQSINHKLLFLSDSNSEIIALQNRFKQQIVVKKVTATKVPNYLLVADYGLLIREQSITNQVASPVKFAEYLACGLKVIISNNLGDYSAFVKQHQCGYIHTDKLEVTKPSIEEKYKLQQLALTSFTKKQFKKEYSLIAQ